MRRNPSLPRLRGDAVLDFCLAAERVDLDEQRWLEGVAAATLPLLPRSDDYAAVCAAIDPETSLWTYTHAFTNSDLPMLAGARVGNESLTRGQRDVVHGTHGIIGFRSSVGRWPRLLAIAESHGIHEMAVAMTSSPRGIVAVFVHLEQELQLDPRSRAHWAELTAHLSRASRLRHGIAGAQLADADAIFGPDGQCVHAQRDMTPSMLSRLRARVLARERIRTRGEDDPQRALACWSSDCGAGWTIVDHFERGGDRWIVIWPNPMAQRGPRALSPNERRMLACVLDGWSNRAAAAELGLSHASASRVLARALRKLGLRDLGVLSTWRSHELAGDLLALPLGLAGLVAVGVPTSKAEAIDELTSSERAVLAELVRGRTNREIGSLRGTSERTVANQVQSIFDKLGAGSRRELLHRLGAMNPVSPG